MTKEISMKTKGIIVCGVALVGLALAPSAVRAQCNVFPPSPPDGRFTERAIPNGTSNVAFFFRATSGRSYSIEAGQDQEIGGITYTFGALGDACPAATAAGYRNTSDIEPSFFFPGDGQRMSLPAPGNDYYVMRVTNASGATVNIRYTVSDTTQYSPAWSTNGSYNTFYSLYNTTNATCTGTLTLYDTAGVVADTQALTVTSGATGSTNTSAMGTPRNMAGTAKFVHDCPPGAFLAEAAIANFSISPTPYFQFVHFEGTREARTH
jgi:hypothetical protein